MVGNIRINGTFRLHEKIKVMKWIKSSERQPNWFDGKTIHCRHIVSGEVMQLVNWGEEVEDLLFRPAFDYKLDFTIKAEFVEWLDESIDWIEDMYLSVYKMHLYKERGNTDSYSKFNEGWSDACSVFESELEKHFGKSKK